MSLDATNFHPQGPVKSVDLMQFYNLFTGVMTDQPVAFSNSLTVGGNQGLTTVPLRLYGASGQNTDLIDLYADKTAAQPGFGISAPGRLAWGTSSGAQDTFLSRVATQNGHGGDTLGLLVDPYLEIKGSVVATSPGAVGTRTKSGIPSDSDVLSPLDGMLIIDTANHAFYFRSGAQWRQVTGGGGGSATTVEEEFVPANGATTITLSQKPTDVWVVSRNGLVQSEASGHYTWLDFTLTFAQAFTGTERVIVAYCIGSLVPSMAGPTTSVHEEFKPAAATTTIVLSQVPQTISMVAREGVIQSQTDGNYSLSASTLTFTDAFSGSERVVVDYASTQFTPLINSNNIADGAIQTVDLANAAVTNAKLASDTARANLLTNGGFEIWQRGNGPFTANSAFHADRWQLGIAASDTLSISKGTGGSVDGLYGSNACAVCTFTLSGGGGASNVSQLLRTTADGNQIAGRTITVSIRVLATVANAIRVGLHNGSAWSYSGFHTGGGTYETLTVTVSVPSGTATVTLQTLFAASGTYYLDNAMLVVGSQAADYAPMHPADDLARCMRYYEVMGPSGNYSLTVGGIATAGSQTFRTSLRHIARKSITPTVTKVGTWSLGNASGQPLISNVESDGFVLSVVSNAAGDTFAQNPPGCWITCEANP